MLKLIGWMQKFEKKLHINNVICIVLLQLELFFASLKSYFIDAF